MTDYGHQLEFGVFITPAVSTGLLPVQLAQVAEDAGLDLATFQDHPYQPGFQDTWTLLSFVAAATSAIRLSPNVLNLPLRQPAVIARAAAGLDVLTGGRVELGLGAGAFWDAVSAMGGPRRSAPEAVEALTEAISIIRGIWDIDAPGVLRVPGRHYQVDGAKRGPAPAHAIGIWIGAYKPRMLRLIGRSADGWLPSLGYLQPGDLTRGNAIIDDAAESSGRPVSAVRRLLNISGRFGTDRGEFLDGPPEQWVEQLAGLALTEGIGTFILATDDATTMTRFGAEIAPAVRDLVAEERVYPAAAEPAGAEPAGTDPAAGRTGPAESSDQQIEIRAGLVRTGPYDRLGVAPTPDPGIRLVADQPWDESTRPHRPEFPADTAYTRQGRLVGVHLIEVHDMLRSELDRIRDLVGQVKQGQLGIGDARSAINQMTMRQNNWTLGAYCESYCRTVTQHHSGEDQAVFPYLRRSEAALEPVIDRLVAEHRVIHDVLDGVDRALVAMVADPDALDEVQRAVDLLTDTLLSHLSYEEYELVEPLARLGFFAGQV